MKLSKIITALFCVVSLGSALEVNKQALEYFNKAISYQQSNNINKAIEYYQKAVSSDPKFSEAYINLGSVYIEKGDIENAKSNMKKACSLGNSAGCENFNNLNQ